MAGDQCLSIIIQKLEGEYDLELQPIDFPNASPFAHIYPKLDAAHANSLRVNSAIVDPPQ